MLKKNFIVQSVGLLTAGFLLSGCKSSIPETPVPDAAPAVGTITLIRSESEPTAPSVQVLAGNEIVAVIDNFSSVTFELPVGTQLLSFNWPDTPITFDDEITVELEPGDHKYISVLHRFEVPGFIKGEDASDYTIVETLAAFELPPDFARAVVENLEAGRAAAAEQQAAP